jgi:hypothetical protein
MMPLSSNAAGLCLQAVGWPYSLLLQTALGAVYQPDAGTARRASRETFRRLGVLRCILQMV